MPRMLGHEKARNFAKEQSCGDSLLVSFLEQFLSCYRSSSLDQGSRCFRAFRSFKKICSAVWQAASHTKAPRGSQREMGFGTAPFHSDFVRLRGQRRACSASELARSPLLVHLQNGLVPPPSPLRLGGRETSQTSSNSAPALVSLW